MAAKVTRSAPQRDALRAEIAERYKRGETQTAIGRALALSQQQISYYLKHLVQEWRTRADLAIDAIQAQELARIDLLEREARAEYERSKRPVQKRQVVTEAAKAGNDSDGPPGEVVRTTETTEGRVGDVRFLAVEQWCVEQRCKLFGLYPQAPPVSLTLVQPPIREVVVTLKHAESVGD